MILNPFTKQSRKNNGKIELGKTRIIRVPINIEISKFRRHTAILAQSGSGKSFLLGRLIEELGLKTLAKIIIFDLNSDFIRLNKINEEIWQDKKFMKWFFPNETLEEFTRQWKDIKIDVASNHNLQGAKRLVLDWGSLSYQEMASVMNIDARRDSDLFWCLFLLWKFASDTWDAAQEPNYDFDHFREKAEIVIEFMHSGQGPQKIKEYPLAKHLKKTISQQSLTSFRSIIDTLGDYDIWRSKGDDETDIRKFIPGNDDAPRILIIDLKSLSNEQERIAITNSILARLWELGKNEHWEAIRDYDKPEFRIPTFIVMDEAHNLVPEEKHSPAVQELADEIIRIAAEGRKFNLNLVVATQRPRKIDSNILTECDNLILMRMTNDSDIEYAKKTFGLLSSSSIRDLKRLTLGSFFLAGEIAASSRVLHCAPRRTIEGGKNIPDKTWIISKK